MKSNYVLEVSWGCPSEKWPLNGVFQFDQAKAICEAGRNVVFLALDLRSLRRWRHWGITRSHKNGIDIYEYNFPLGGFPPSIKYKIQDFAFSRSIKRIEKDFGKPDVIHVHTTQQAISITDYCLENNVPYIVTEHITPVFEGSFIEKRKKQALINSKMTVSVSNALAKDIKKSYGVDSVVIPNIVDGSIFQYSPKEKKNYFEFLAAASMSYGKGFDVLIKAFASLHDVNGESRLHLTIMGDGPERNEIEKLTKEYGIADLVTFTGSYSRIQFAEELAKSDCFVLTSRSETFGIVYIEALATGTPVIATKCGGPEDIVNDSNGLLVDIDDINGLTSAMKKALVEVTSYDNSRIAEDCKANYSSSSVAERLLTILD